jgi:D-alanyl-D-alanine carboxypeptidase
MTLRLAFVAANLVLLGIFVQQSLSSSFSPSDSHRELGEAAGYVPDGVTVFDDIPAVTKLDPGLRAALRKAATAAGHEGIEFYVNSGWRSPEYQAQLLKDAVAQYGSEREAARWVATPETSPHVSGKAIDIGRSDATTWLSRHGAAYGLCQIYDNEPWHYELRPAAVERGCPQRYADPAHDPRTQVTGK